MSATDKVTKVNPKIKLVQKEPNLSKLKRTNRPIRSCTKCQKRKVKCNFEIPCDRCISRNQAHLCTRDPVIYDGLLVNNADKQELKFSQENEVLKRKIRELQDTVIRMKTENLKGKEKVISKGQKSRANNILTFNNNRNLSYNKTIKLDESIIKETVKKSRKSPSNLNDSSEWSTYSSIISLLKKGLGNGSILDNSNSESNEMDYNTEEWLILNDKSYLKYNGEDSKSKCWQYELDKINLLEKSTCDKLIKNGLNINQLYQIIDEDEFLTEYENYWSNKEIPQKHLVESYSKSAYGYLFLGLMYALMCYGVYQSNTDHNMSDPIFEGHDWDTYAKGFFAASLDCLYRGRYMTCPKFRSIQIIIMLRSLSGLLGGHTFSNSLTSVAFFLSYKLQLVKSKNIYQVNSLWNLLAYDWYDEIDRYSLSEVSSFSDLAIPEKWICKKDNILNWDNFYLLFAIRIAIVKKEYYFNDSLVTLESLKKADLELRYLQVEAFRDIDEYSVTKYPEISNSKIHNIQFHVSSLLYHEILEINLKMAAFLTYEQWANICYQTCFNNACGILRIFGSTDLSINCKTYASVCENVIHAAVFLLIDCTLDDKHLKNEKKVLSLISQTINIFTSFKSVVRSTIRGIYVIGKLKNLLLKKKSKMVNTLHPDGYSKNGDTIGINKQHLDSKNVVGSKVLENSEKATLDKLHVHKSKTGINELELNLADKHDGDIVDVSNNKNGDEFEEEEEEEEEEEDDDMPLYCSTLSNKSKDDINVKTMQFIKDQNLIGGTTALTSNSVETLPNEILQPFNFDNPHALFDKPLPLSLLSSNLKLKKELLIDSTNESLTNPIQTPNASFSNLPEDNAHGSIAPPVLHNKIMDILEDSGWSQFLNSIDDLDM